MRGGRNGVSVPASAMKDRKQAIRHIVIPGEHMGTVVEPAEQMQDMVSADYTRVIPDQKHVVEKGVS